MTTEREAPEVSSDQWHTRIRSNLRGFWEPEQDLELLGQDYVERGTTCQACGKEGIKHAFILRNNTTSQGMYVGSECRSEVFVVARQLEDEAYLAKWGFPRGSCEEGWENEHHMSIIGEEAEMERTRLEALTPGYQPEPGVEIPDNDDMSYDDHDVEEDRRW